MSTYLQSPRAASSRPSTRKPGLSDAERKRQEAIERRQRRDELARKITEAVPLKRRTR